MTVMQPPRLASWLLERLASGDKRESLIGDLDEQYRRGRSIGWFWRQALRTILIGVGTDLRDHKLLAVRAFAISSMALSLLNSVRGPLRRSLIGWWTVPWKSEILRQMVAYYGLPFVVLNCLGCALIGWMMAKLHRDHRAVVVILSAVAQLPSAVLWAYEMRRLSEMRRLLYVGLSPFWDSVFLFHAAVLFIVYPTFVLLGGARTTFGSDRRPGDSFSRRRVIALGPPEAAGRRASARRQLFASRCTQRRHTASETSGPS